MGICELSKRRSKDPNTQVGACIINSDNKIIGIGYNGLPKGCNDDEFPWSNDKDFLNTKYPYVVHAEANAILNSIADLKGATIYVSLFPCNECMKLIIQTGIKKIIFKENKYPDSKEVLAATKLASAAGIIIEEYNEKSI